MSGNIIHKQCSNGPSIVRACDCTISFLARGVPNLRLYDLVVDVDATGGEFNANGGFRFQTEFVLRKSRQEVRFPNAGVSDQHHLEQVVVIIVRSIRTHFPSSFSHDPCLQKMLT
ncbi:hypothetical protein V8G54_023922 [Vigna mungo]|uniref:Uncharacterized protein n=1 Tax=Vigna mungo TaxID=3915 RepID=A0AAQ3N5V3_VIGMU